MLGLRLDLQTLLEEITDHVYFQPPSSTRMQYPCIMYVRDGSKADHADNKLYHHTKRYQVTVVDRNPDSNIPDAVENLPLCIFDRSYIADSLNHFVFSLYF